MGQHRDGGADRLHVLEGAAQIPFPERMMIVDVQLDPWPPGDGGERTDALGLAHIHQDQASDSVEIDIANAFETVGVKGAFQEEIPQTAFLGAGEDHLRLGIKAFGRDHGAQAVEIGIDVSGDNVHRACEG